MAARHAEAGGGAGAEAARPAGTRPARILDRIWYGPADPVVAILRALLVIPELAFRSVVAGRNALYRGGLLRSYPAAVPTISVGNLTVGGTGKTPLVRWMTQTLAAGGRTPGILHGGYAGDEPALHRRWFPDLPVVAERDRVRAAASAVARGADVLILDDAFQHRRIQRNLDIVVVAAERWTPRPRLLPRGPYREALAALARADLVVVTRRTAPVGEGLSVARDVGQRVDVPVAVAHLAPAGWLTAGGEPREDQPGHGVAVAAIGRPDAFFDQVADLGVELRRRLSYRDHHEYGAEDARTIRMQAGEDPVITTAKDAVKLAPLLPDTDLWVLDQAVVFEARRDAVLAALEDVAG